MYIIVREPEDRKSFYKSMYQCFCRLKLVLDKIRDYEEVS